LSEAPLALGSVGIPSGISPHRGSMLLTLAALSLWRSVSAATVHGRKAQKNFKVFSP